MDLQSTAVPLLLCRIPIVLSTWDWKRSTCPEISDLVKAFPLKYEAVSQYGGYLAIPQTNLRS